MLRPLLGVLLCRPLVGVSTCRPLVGVFDRVHLSLPGVFDRGEVSLELKDRGDTLSALFALLPAVCSAAGLRRVSLSLLDLGCRGGRPGPAGGLPAVSQSSSDPPSQDTQNFRYSCLKGSLIL